MAVGTPGGTGKITIKPRSTDILPIHIKVPMNAPPGDHVGAVVVSLNGLVSGRFGHGGVQQENLAQRLAIKALVRVSGPAQPNLSIQHLHASYRGPIDPFAKGQVTVTYQVHNGGNVVLGGPQQVTVHGLFGERVAGKGVAALPPLLPGATYPVTVSIPGVYPEMVMSAKVTISEQGLVGDLDPGLSTVSSSVHFFAIPWIVLLVLLLAILLLAWRYTRRRHRRVAEVVGGRHRRSVPIAEEITA